MRKGCVVGLSIVLALVLSAGPAWAKKPPPADESAQGACELVREMHVNDEYGFSGDVRVDKPRW